MVSGRNWQGECKLCGNEVLIERIVTIPKCLRQHFTRYCLLDCRLELGSSRSETAEHTKKEELLSKRYHVRLIYSLRHKTGDGHTVSKRNRHFTDFCWSTENCSTTRIECALRPGKRSVRRPAEIAGTSPAQYGHNLVTIWWCLKLFAPVLPACITSAS